jgi:hypothetical protein
MLYALTYSSPKAIAGKISYLLHLGSWLFFKAHKAGGWALPSQEQPTSLSNTLPKAASNPGTPFKF